MLDFLAKNPTTPNKQATTKNDEKNRYVQSSKKSNTRLDEINGKSLNFESIDYSKGLEQKILRSHQITNEFLSFLDSFGQRTVPNIYLIASVNIIHQLEIKRLYFFLIWGGCEKKKINILNMSAIFMRVIGEFKII